MTNEDNKLQVLVQESGLELSDAEQIKQSYLPYFESIAEVKEASKRINFDAPTEFDEEYARQLRLKLVKVRTGSEEVKINRKKIHTLRANVEQSAWNLIRDTCAIDEERFLQIEKTRERREAMEKEIRKKERLERVKPFLPEGFNMDGLDLVNMPEETFEIVVTGLIKQHNDREAGKAKAELERQQREQQEAEDREAQRIENERLRKEYEEKEKQFQAEHEKREAAEAEQRRIQEEADRKIREQTAAADAEAKRVKDEADEKERKRLESERRAENKRKAEEEIALKKERDAKEAAEAETKRLRDAEAKRLRDDQEAKDNAERERKAEESRKAMAPDKEKLRAWIETIRMSEPAALTDLATKKLAFDIKKRFAAMTTWANAEIEKL